MFGRRWEVDRDIPEPVISKLEEHYPNVKLSVANHNRLFMDIRLSSSPLLHSLSFRVLNYTATVVEKHQSRQCSELSDLREVLLRAPSLRKLDINFDHSPNVRRTKRFITIFTRAVLNLPLTPTDRLPPLQELTFSGLPAMYIFDPEHCKVLSQCMDWTQLRRLDLGVSCPEHFFKEIGRTLRSLKSLTMGLEASRYTYRDHGLSPFSHFLRSIPELLELHLTDFSAVVHEVAPIILGRERSLHTLSYHVSVDRDWNCPKEHCTWTALQIKCLLECSPGLCHLELSIPLVGG